MSFAVLDDADLPAIGINSILVTFIRRILKVERKYITSCIVFYNTDYHVNVLFNNAVRLVCFVEDHLSEPADCNSFINTENLIQIVYLR